MHARTHAHTCMRTCMRAHTRTCTHTHKDAHTHARTHAHHITSRHSTVNTCNIWCQHQRASWALRWWRTSLIVRKFEEIAEDNERYRFVRKIRWQSDLPSGNHRPARRFPVVFSPIGVPWLNEYGNLCQPPWSSQPDAATLIMDRISPWPLTTRTGHHFLVSWTAWRPQVADSMASSN
jgi:hypothetical protein